MFISILIGMMLIVNPMIFGNYSMDVNMNDDFIQTMDDNYDDSNGDDAYGGIHRGDQSENQEEDGDVLLKPKPRGGGK